MVSVPWQHLGWHNEWITSNLQYWPQFLHCRVILEWSLENSYLFLCFQKSIKNIYQQNKNMGYFNSALLIKMYIGFICITFLGSKRYSSQRWILHTMSMIGSGLTVLKRCKNFHTCSLYPSPILLPYTLT